MLRVGMQSSVAVNHEEPLEDLRRLKEIGFSGIDFSLHSYLTNKDLYKEKTNSFFDKSDEELCDYFSALKSGCADTGIEIFQMHMPYPNYVPTASKEFNDYLREVMAIKSMKICDYLKCKYIVIHGFKLSRFLGSEELEWQETQGFLEFLAPFAAEHGIATRVSGFDAVLNQIGEHIIVTANVPDDDISKNIHAALYSSDGALLDYMLYPAEYSNNTVHFMFRKMLDLSYIKVFLWNGFETMIPLDDSIVLNVSK